MSTVANNPMQYFYNVSPLLKACKDDVTNCRCTDPSYGYQTKCSINASTTDHSGRSHCTFNNPTIGTTNSVGPLATKSGLVYKAPTEKNGKQPFTDPGSSTPIQGAATTYPRPLMFCSDPTSTGSNSSALPSSPNIGITWSSGAGFTPNTWTGTPAPASSVGNIGFN